MIRATADYALPDIPIVTNPRGRVCAAEGCGTVLSVYNPECFCSVHGDEEMPVPAGHHRCNKCRRVLPFTRDHYHANGRGGLHPTCKECKQSHKRRTRGSRPLPEGERTCPGCGRTKPLDTDNWYLKRNEGRWSSLCRWCVRHRNREHARAVAQAKREAVNV